MIISKKELNKLLAIEKSKFFPKEYRGWKVSYHKNRGINLRKDGTRFYIGNKWNEAKADNFIDAINNKIVGEPIDAKE